MAPLHKYLPCSSKDCSKKECFRTNQLATAIRNGEKPRGHCDGEGCGDGYFFCVEHRDHSEHGEGKLRKKQDPVKIIDDYNAAKEALKREQPDSGHDETGPSQPPPPPSAGPSTTVNTKWGRCTPMERKAIILCMFIALGIITGDSTMIDSQLHELEVALTGMEYVVSRNRDLADCKCVSCNTSLFVRGYASTDEQNPNDVYCDECGEGRSDVTPVILLNDEAVANLMAIMRQHRQYLVSDYDNVVTDFTPSLTRMPGMTTGAVFDGKMYVTVPQLKTLLESLTVTALHSLLTRIRNGLAGTTSKVLSQLRTTFTSFLSRSGTKSKNKCIDHLMTAVENEQYLSFNPDTIQKGSILHAFIEKFRGQYWGLRDNTDFMDGLMDAYKSTLVLIGIKGTGTAWHCDRTHARNVAFALLASVSEEYLRIPLAVWILVNPAYVEEVDSKLKELFTRYYTNSTGTKKEKEKYLAFKNGFKSDTHITEELARILQEECGVDEVTNTMKVQILHQCSGDIVNVPAGWVHCVYNLRQCVKVAYDYIVPEHMPLYMLCWKKIFAHLTKNEEDFGCVAEILHTIVRG